MKKKIIVAIMAITVLALGGCGDPNSSDVLNEVAAIEREVVESISESTAEPTVGSTEEAAVIDEQASIPEVVETTGADSTQEIVAAATPTPESTNIASSGGGLTEEQKRQLEEAAARAQQKIDADYEKLTSGNASQGSNNNGGSSGNGNTSSAANSGSTSSSSSSNGSSSSGNTAGNSGSAGNTGNNTAGGSVSPKAEEQPATAAQHSHSYAWVENGDTRIMTCSCGATTGSAENKIADGVWGYWGDASALLTAVNNQRAYGERYTVSDELGNIIGVVEGLPALDNSLSASAQSLAISAAQTNSYYGRGIHAGGSAQDAVSSWVGTGLMSNEKTTSGGVACLNKSNGDGTYTTIWVLVVG